MHIRLNMAAEANAEPSGSKTVMPVDLEMTKLGLSEKLRDQPCYDAVARALYHASICQCVVRTDAKESACQRCAKLWLAIPTPKLQGLYALKALHLALGADYGECLTISQLDLMTDAVPTRGALGGP